MPKELPISNREEIFGYLDRFAKLPGVEDFLDATPPPIAAMMFASCCYKALGVCSAEDAKLISGFVAELLEQFRATGRA